MKRSWTLAVLCLALGAVRAEAQSQNPQLRVFTESGPVVLGSHHPCVALLPNVALGGRIHFLIGTPGSSTVQFGSTQVNVLLANPMVLLSTMAKRNLWYGRIPVPNDPSLVGLTMQLGLVVVNPSANVILSPLVPFGPIIEDSIQ